MKLMSHSIPVHWNFLGPSYKYENCSIPSFVECPGIPYPTVYTNTAVSEFSFQALFPNILTISSGCRWRRQPTDMGISCRYIEYAIMDSWQGVVLQLGGLTRV
jgi:hypothetical protein